MLKKRDTVILNVDILLVFSLRILKTVTLRYGN
jgi:hypothetical protein